MSSCDRGSARDGASLGSARTLSPQSCGYPIGPTNGELLSRKAEFYGATRSLIMNPTIPTFDLDRFLKRISSQMNLAGSHGVRRPADTSKLEAVPMENLVSAAARHGLRVVRRMGGTVFEFTRLPLSDFPYRSLRFPN